MEEIKPGIYKHFKGKFCDVICTAKHSDRDEILVIYRGVNDGGFFARPAESFLGTATDKEGNTVARFTPATDAELENLKEQGLIR